MKRLIFPILMGIVGVAILLGLGFWQLQRLEWKTEILNEINTRIAAEPVALPAEVNPEKDRFMPVRVEGALTGEEITVLTSGQGAGYRVISVMEMADGRRIMVDLGFVTLEAKDTPRVAPDVVVTGNLHWPQETDRWTPKPDEVKGIWFARDVNAMAMTLFSDPVLVIAASVSGADLGVTPLPLDTVGIPNDHLNYAITWFSLAFVWLVMSGFLIFRVARAARED
ncbi:MAG: SURF1 family protein [Rhodobacterales bacterium]|jgi:surfeit locus 1 family protein|nr:SURF1 family protein [Rhodobacterales bacterium]